MVYKKTWKLLQETIPVSAITSVNHVYLHKRSSQPELSVMKQCIQNLTLKENEVQYFTHAIAKWSGLQNILFTFI